MRALYSVWFAPIWLISFLLLLTITTLLIYAFGTGGSGLLPLFSDYLFNTLLLLLGVGICATFLGALLAILVSFYRFPGVKLFQWGLFLPFAMPSYIIAYRMQQFDDYQWAFFLPKFRSEVGLIIILSLVLYPYVYLITRTALQKQSGTIIDAARVMGYSYWHSLVKIALPLCWPALVAGASLVLLEVLNEYGAVALSTVPTLSVGIIDLWWSLGETNAAAQLSVLALIFVILCYWAEQFGRGHRQFYQNSNIKFQPLSTPRLTGVQAYCAILLCSLPILLGFVLPIGLLLYDALTLKNIVWFDYLTPAYRSILLAIITSLCCIFLGISASHILRNQYKSRIFVRIMQAGYALPGILLAIGLILGFSGVISLINHVFAWFNLPAFYFSSSILLMLIAYICRFNHIAVAGIYSDMQKLSPILDDAAVTLGRKRTNILKNIHLPLLDNSMRVIFLLILVDVLKELPASLVLRPFNFDTLAVNVFEYASDERIEQAAPGALMIVLAGLLPVIYLSRMLENMGKQNHA